MFQRRFLLRLSSKYTWYSTTDAAADACRAISFPHVYMEYGATLLDARLLVGLACLKFTW